MRCDCAEEAALMTGHGCGKGLGFDVSGKIGVIVGADGRTQRQRQSQGQKKGKQSFHGNAPFT